MDKQAKLMVNGNGGRHMSNMRLSVEHVRIPRVSRNSPPVARSAEPSGHPARRDAGQSLPRWLPHSARRRRRLRGMPHLALALIGLLLTAACSDRRLLIIRDVNVIDVQLGKLLERRTVVIGGNRILRVAGEVHIPATRHTVIDGTGKYLIPGLWDMHVHLQDPGPAALPLLVAHGVTGVRDMGTSLELIREFRGTIARGEIAGPRIQAAGFMIESAAAWDGLLKALPPSVWERERTRRRRVETPEEAREAVRAAAETGADFIKIHWNQSRETFFALADECRRRRMVFAGHDPLTGLSLLEIAEAGQRSIEHIDGSFPLQLSRVDEEGRRRMIAAFREHGTHFVPTLVVFLQLDRIAEANNVEERMRLALSDPRARHLTPDLEEFWSVFLGMYPTLPAIEDFREAFDQLKRLHNEGIRILPGTDLTAPLIFPGSSLHDELIAMAERLEMKPEDVLRSATIHSADFLGLDDLGTVEEGRLADLVLLEANPLEELEHIREVHSVIVDGRYYGPAARKRLLEGARNASTVAGGLEGAERMACHWRR